MALVNDDPMIHNMREHACFLRKRVFEENPGAVKRIIY